MFFLDLAGGKLYPMLKLSVLMIDPVSCCDEWFSNLFVEVPVKWRLGCYFLVFGIGGAGGLLESDFLESPNS